MTTAWSLLEYRPGRYVKVTPEGDFLGKATEAEVKAWFASQGWLSPAVSEPKPQPAAVEEAAPVPPAEREPAPIGHTASDPLAWFSFAPEPRVSHSLEPEPLPVDLKKQGPQFDRVLGLVEPDAEADVVMAPEPDTPVAEADQADEPALQLSIEPGSAEEEPADEPEAEAGAVVAREPDTPVAEADQADEPALQLSIEPGSAEEEPADEPEAEADVVMAPEPDTPVAEADQADEPAPQLSIEPGSAEEEPADEPEAEMDQDLQSDEEADRSLEPSPDMREWTESPARPTEAHSGAEPESGEEASAMDQWLWVDPRQESGYRPASFDLAAFLQRAIALFQGKEWTGGQKPGRLAVHPSQARDGLKAIAEGLGLEVVSDPLVSPDTYRLGLAEARKTG